jgi:phospholipid transport system substrate-binding protein
MKAMNWAAIGTLFAALAFAAPAEAGPATEQLQTQIDGVFKALADPDLKGPEKAERRRAMILEAAENVFDFGTTAKLTLGTHWDTLSQPQRDEFVNLFRGFIGKSYVSTLDLGEGGHSLAYLDEAVDGDRATVKSRVTTSGGSVVPIEFRMIRGEAGRWRLYDVQWEGMSLVSNYRQQFIRIIRAGSYEELVGKLRSKQSAPAASGQ